MWLRKAVRENEPEASPRWFRISCGMISNERMRIHASEESAKVMVVKAASEAGAPRKDRRALALQD